MKVFGVLSMLPLEEFWHEARAHSAFSIGDLCARCHEEVEDLSHIVLSKRRQVELPPIVCSASAHNKSA
eukprot:4424390-Amphidinium_carterae.3